MASVDPEAAGLSAGATPIHDITVGPNRCELRVNGLHAWLRFTYVPNKVPGWGGVGPGDFELIDGRGQSYGTKRAVSANLWTTTWNPITKGEAYKLRVTYLGVTTTSSLSLKAA